MTDSEASAGPNATQDANCCGDGNEAADGPTSARICGAESMPQPGTSASRCTASWYAASAGGPFFGPGLDLTLDELNSGEKQAEDLTLQDAERGRFAEGI